MSNYVQSTNFATKDALPSGDPLKIVKGTEINTEFNNIAVAVATKADLNSPTFTGTPALPTGAIGVTQSFGNNGTALATTAFVQAALPSSVIPSGTAMLFAQSAAPTGFTKSTTHNDKALRVVSGTAGSGGSAAFTTAFGTPAVTGSVNVTGTVAGHTLTTAEIPSHTHSLNTFADFTNTPGVFVTTADHVNLNAGITGATGGGGSHSHGFTGSGTIASASAAINVQYVDVIIATKD
jgi:hypothetical protein